MNVNEAGRTIVVERLPVAKDSLKFVGLQKGFNIVNDIPNTDIIELSEEASQKIDEITNKLNILQIAKKSLSEVSSIAKDIKSSYKTEVNDAFAPLDDSMLKARYNASVQIKNILDNAKYNGKNVFTPNFFADYNLNADRLNLKNLNLRDELSIDIFADNVQRLSSDIESNVKSLQDKINSTKENKWLNAEQLAALRLEQKSVNDTAKAQTPSLAQALAELTQISSAPAVAKDSTESADTANVIEKDSIESTESGDSKSADSKAQNINSNANPQNASAGEGGNTTTESAANESSANETTASESAKTESTESTESTSADSKTTESTNAESSTSTTQDTKPADSTDSNVADSKPQDSNTQNTESKNTESNTAQTTQTTADTTKENPNVVGVVSGDEKEQVVDLYV